MSKILAIVGLLTLFVGSLGTSLYLNDYWIAAIATLPLVAAVAVWRDE